MKKLLFIAVACIGALHATAQTWTTDAAHSKLNFTIVHLGISEQEGTFQTFSVSVQSAAADFSDAVIQLTADINSINTDNLKRDEHLKGTDYFNAAAFPTLTFKSTSFTKAEGNKYKLKGNLTIKGVTKAVELDVVYFGTILHPKTQKPVAGFKITGVIKRSDFNVGASSAALADEVSIIANLELIKN